MLRQTHTHVLDVLHVLHKPLTRSLSTTAVTSAQNHRLPPELDVAEPRLPRWLRRQNAQKGKEKEKEKGDIVPPSSTKDAPKYHSRHLTPEAAKERMKSKEGLKLLEPHVLSHRLKKLCERDKLNQAVSLLKHSPLGAQNAIVWNTLISETMKLQRNNLAYSLYTDMKRRGHNPTTRTFLTLFNGLLRIEDFQRHSRQLVNARGLYNSFKRHLESIKRADPTSPELSVDPLASYIKILGNAKCYNDIFDVFYSLDDDGPLAPNPRIFSSMFQVLASRPDNETPTFRQGDARLLWSQVVKASKRRKDFIIDAPLATTAISALTRGQISDHDLAFQITRDFFGLCPPGTPRITGTSPLSPQSLAAVFRLCNESQNYDLCIEFFNQVKRRPVDIGGVELLDRPHMDEVLRAYQALNVPASGYQSLQTLEWMLRQEASGPNGGKIRPQSATYHIVLVTCWHSADWNSATRTFDLMTGYHSHDFMDGAVAASPRFDQRASGRNLVPTAETLSTLVRTAYATRNRSHMRQCLRIIDYLGIDNTMARTTQVTEESRKVLKTRGFFVTKLAQGIIEMVDYVNAGQKEHKHPGQQERWKVLVERAKLELRESGEEALIPTLQRQLPVESSPLTPSRGVGLKRAGVTTSRQSRNPPLSPHEL